MFFIKRPPIVFVHGMFGAMGGGILKGNGAINFGISEIMYRPIIDTLKEFGYREDEDLFISYYDWTKSNIRSAEDYLVHTIDKAKKKTNSSHVDIISHSMGGLVARAYAQSEFYRGDINKLIMIATPNAGATTSYYFWSGGELGRDSYRNLLDKIIKNGFLWYIRFKYKTKIDIEFIRKNIPSIGELLPSYEYGDYLISIDENNDIPIKEMVIKNDFLNDLNNNKDILKKRKIKTYMIIGKDVDTVDKIKVKKSLGEHEKWKDGKPMESIKTQLGDGTVTCNSNKIIDGKIKYISSNHTGILKECKYELSRILNIRKRYKAVNSDYFMIYSIIAKDISDIDILICGEKLINNYKDFNSNNIVSKEIMKDTYWIIIQCSEEKIHVSVTPSSESSKLIICKGHEDTGIIKEKDVDVLNKLNLEI